MSVRGANIKDVITYKPLEPHKYVSLNIFNQVPNMDVPVGVG